MLCSKEANPTSLWNLLVVGCITDGKGVKTAFIFSCMKNSCESETHKLPCHLVSQLSYGPKFPADSCSIKTLTGSTLEIIKKAMTYLFICFIFRLIKRNIIEQWLRPFLCVVQPF